MVGSQALGEDEVGVLLWQFSLPAIIGMVVNSLYNVIDSIFVGNGVGEIGLAAVALAFPIMIVMMAFGMLIGIGAATLVSIKLGEKNTAVAEKILGNSIILIVIVSVVLSTILLAVLDPVLTALGADQNVLPYARDFTRIILAGSIFMYIGFGLNNIVRAEGSPRTAMATMLISALLNTVLNPLFIFVLKMGIAGSALATVLSQAASAIWVMAYFFSRASFLKVRRQNLKPDRTIMLGIVRIGLSPFLMQIAASGVTVLSNYSLLKYGGELAVAALGIISRISMLVLMPIFGISQGVQPIIGYNFGAQKFQRVIEAFKLAVIAATVIATLGFLLIQVFDRYIIRLFNNNPELIALGSHGLRLMMSMLPIIGFQVIGASYFQAVGKANYSIALSLSRQVILLVPLLLILPQFLGLNGVWLAGPAADILSALLTGWFILAEAKRIRESGQA